MFVATVCVTTTTVDDRELGDTMRRCWWYRAGSFHRLSAHINVRWLALCEASTYLCFSYLSLTKRSRSREFPTLPWVLVARRTISAIKPPCIRPSGTTHDNAGLCSSDRPSRLATFVLSSMSSSRGCNRYGAMDPQRQVRPSIKQRPHIKILQSPKPPVASSRTQESVQQKTVRKSSPPQNEQRGGGEGSFVTGSNSSCRQ